NVGEPLGADQALDVGLNLLLVERLPGPAEELRSDLLHGDRGVTFDAQFRDGSFGKSVPLLLSTAASYQDSGRITGNQRERSQRNRNPDPGRGRRRTAPL